jgi:hypothetical protein
MTQKPGSVSTTRLPMGSPTAFQLTPCHRCSYLARGPIVGNQVCLPNTIGPGPFPPIVDQGYHLLCKANKSRTALHIVAMTNFSGPSSSRFAGRCKPRAICVLSQKPPDHREMRAEESTAEMMDCEYSLISPEAH